MRRRCPRREGGLRRTAALTALGRRRNFPYLPLRLAHVVMFTSLGLVLIRLARGSAGRAALCLMAALALASPARGAPAQRRRGLQAARHAGFRAGGRRRASRRQPAPTTTRGRWRGSRASSTSAPALRERRPVPSLPTMFGQIWAYTPGGADGSTGHVGARVPVTDGLGRPARIRLPLDDRVHVQRHRVHVRLHGGRPAGQHPAHDRRPNVHAGVARRLSRTPSRGFPHDRLLHRGERQAAADHDAGRQGRRRRRRTTPTCPTTRSCSRTTTRRRRRLAQLQPDADERSGQSTRCSRCTRRTAGCMRASTIR